MKKTTLVALILAYVLLLSSCAAPDAAAPETVAPSPAQHTETPVTTPSQTPAPPEPAKTEPAVEVVPDSDELVCVADYIPGVYVELKYATSDNFTGGVIYDFTDAYLRYGTVMKLQSAQEELAALGYSLKIWDAFRPVAAQFALWEACPDPQYVANPNTGYSSHSKGNTLDVTLVTLDGAEVPMPTGFDDFSAKAGRDYSDVPEPAASNARLLEDIMTANGFNGYSAEWWHFSDTESYPVAESFTISAASNLSAQR